MKTLDDKLKKIKSANYNPANFIIADAKDADIEYLKEIEQEELFLQMSDQCYENPVRGASVDL